MSDEEELKEIEDRERALYNALQFGDADTFMELLSEDATYIHWTSVAESREEAVAGLRHGLYTQDGATFTVSRTARLLGDAALTRGIIDIVDTSHGSPHTFRLRQSLVWIREDGAWKLLLSQATRVDI